MTNAQYIWNYLKLQGFTDAGAAGALGNLFAESGLNPKNLQNNYEKKLGYNNETYTNAVDKKTYRNFVHDNAGYGLCQWTYWTRKQELLNLAQTKKLSIGNLDLQLDFFIYELKKGYNNLLQLLKTTNSIQEASNGMLLQFEKPADQSLEVQKRRVLYGKDYYKQFANKEEINTMSIATYTKISPNKSTRKNKIDTITIHCIVGQWTAKQGCDYFAKTSAQASSNWVVGYDGSIGLSVPEEYRAWTSGGTKSINGISGAMNDHRAVTIEVASDTYHPYVVTTAAYNALIDLLVDICKRNNIPKLLWENNINLVGNVQKQNMTAHRFFANKSCPGDYLYSRFGAIAAAVNARLATNNTLKEEKEVTQEQFNKMMDNWIAEQAKKPITWESDMEWAVKKGLVIGDETGATSPKKFMTRGEFITVLKRLVDKAKIIF